MKSLILKEGVINYGDILNTNNQVAFSAWKPGVKIFPGIYALHIVNSMGLNINLGQFKYSDNSEDEWVRIPNLKWINVPVDGIFEFLSFIQTVDTFRILPMDKYYSSPENWKYKIYVKTKEESGEGLREPEEFVPTVEFCNKSIEAVGSNKTLMAKCPYDPATGKQMEKCLNWRRTDQVGSACYKIMDMKAKKDSIREFCEKYTYLADCKCVNRLNYPEYRRQKNLRDYPDHCWYYPCKSGTYLLDQEGQLEKCNGNYCLISYNNSNGAANINFSENTAISCYNMEIPLHKDSSKKRF